MERSILIVDDEPQTRDLLRLMLKRDGYEVFEAEDGADALEKIALHRPDLILLDVMMPGMDGIEVCETLRSREEMTDLPIIMLSARTHMDAVELGVRAGATRYLAKPIGRQELLRHVDEVLKGIPSLEMQLMRDHLAARAFSGEP